MKTLASLALSFATLSSAHATNTGGCDLVPSGSVDMDSMNRATLLRTGEYAELEASFDRLLAQVRAGQRTDLHVVRAVHEMLQLASREEGPIVDWAQKNPLSFFAQLTSGFYHVNQAGYARGNGSLSQTSARQIAAMQALNKTADQYLQAALKIAPTSAMPFVGLISIAAQEAGSEGVAKQLAVANRADPRGLAARVAAMRYLAPRWGGSFEMMDAAVQGGAALPPDQFHYLKYNAILEKASHFEVIEKDKQVAYPLFKQALGMCNNSPTAQNGMARTVR